MAEGLEDLEVLEIDDLDAEAWFDFASEQGWTDGMPVLPPTEAAVARFLETCRGDNEPFLPLPPRQVVPTVRSLVANAVMAGCKPEYFSVLTAAVRAISAPAYNLHGTLATTHSCAPMVFVSGPICRELSINSKGNCFGQGWRANATIGRALGLITRNIGGAVPGATDRSTQGSPAKFTFCFGENEDESPWESDRVRRGFSRDQSIVTVMAAEPPHNINDHGSTSGEALIDYGRLGDVAVRLECGVWRTVVCRQGPNMPLPCIVTDGRLRRFTAAVRDGQNSGAGCFIGNRDSFLESVRAPVDGFYTVAPTPADIHIAVAGGDGKHSAWIPSFGMTEVISVAMK